MKKDKQNNVVNILFGDKIVFESVTAEKRKVVFEYLSKGKYSEALDLVNSIIKMNIEYISENTQEIVEKVINKKKEDKEKDKEKEDLQKSGTIKEKPLIHFAKISLDDLYKKTIEKIISTHLYFQEYYSNILLAIHIYTKINSRDKIQRTLLFLKREMLINKYSEINQIIIQFMIQNENNIEKTKDKNNVNTSVLKEPINLFKSMIPAKLNKKQAKVPQELYTKCEDIYFNSLKVYISCAQYAVNLREINLYEEFILEFVIKINLLLSKDNYIICNTFLLLANLYMKMGSVKKAYCLYEKIINKNQQGLPKDKNMCKVLISANYNLGLILYITGKYENSKLRLENALEIKKTITKNNYDIELIKIYETLAEVDVQYKNYSSAYIYIQEGIKLLINKGSPNPTPENIYNKDHSHKHLYIKNSKEKFDDKDSDESLSNEGNKKITFKQKFDNELNSNTLQKYTNEELILNKKFKILKNYIGSKLSETLLFTKYDNVDIQKNINSHNIGNVFNYMQMKNTNMNRRKERNDDAEENRLFKDFLDLDGNEPINDERTINERELSTFILFIASLSEKQLRKLNNDQPKDYEYNKKHPIIFSKDFKDSLTGIQRYNFCQLRLSSLTRIKVLSDYNKKISNKNMKYKGLYKTQNMSEIDKINLYVEGKGILGMWENDEEVEKEDMDDSESEKNVKWKKGNLQKDEEDIEEKSNTKSITKEENKNKINYSFEQNEKFGFTDMMKLSKEIFFEGSDYINYDRFKEFVYDFFKTNYKDELGYINDEFIIMITKDLDKSKIKKILFNPKLLYDLLVIYAKSKGIEIERPKKRRKTKNSKEDKIIFLHAA